jgi:hypothetical protein
VERCFLEIGIRQVGALEVAPLETLAGQIAACTFQRFPRQERSFAFPGFLGDSAAWQQRDSEYAQEE